MNLKVLALSAMIAFGTVSVSAGPVDESWRILAIKSEPVGADELPQGAMHESWYFTVHSPRGDGACPGSQAMISFARDTEAVRDRLLFTVVAGAETHNFSADFPPGSLGTTTTLDNPPSSYVVRLGDNRATTRHLAGAWTVEAASGDAAVQLTLNAPRDARGLPLLWRRRAPEGAGLREVVFAPRAAASGTLRIGERTCAIDGTGSFEHSWGHWSRAPIRGVDFLGAHLENGWSVYARRTPMRGDDDVFPVAGQKPAAYWPPAMVLTDGSAVFEANNVSFTAMDATAPDPVLGVPVPTRFEVTGMFTHPETDVLQPRTVTLRVAEPRFAAVPFSETSSGLLEGWGAATLSIDGAPEVPGTAEIGIQRFGARGPG